jgi:hypothetical protein
MLCRVASVASGETVKASTPNILTFPGASKSGSRRAMRKDFLRALRFSGSPVIVDFTGCGPFNHDDIDLLLECVAEVSGRDTQLVLAAGSRVNRVLLEVTRISSLVPVYSSLEEALLYPRPSTSPSSNTTTASDAEDARVDQFQTQSQNPERLRWSA